MINSLKILFIFFFVLLISACEFSSQGELANWMANERSQIKPKPLKLTEPKVFEPVVFLDANRDSPFDPVKLTRTLSRQVSSDSRKMMDYERNRVKEALESVPLDSITMVGSMKSKTGVMIGLVTTNNLLYQVKVGNYLGQNYGLITKIAENEIDIRELIDDGAVELIERPAILMLKEVNK